METGLDFDLDRTNAREMQHSPDARVEQLDIGRRLKVLRQERDWTLSEDSQKTGIAHSTLSKIERGEISPTLGTLQKIADGLNIDIVALLSNDTSKDGWGRRSVWRRNPEAVHATKTCKNNWVASDLKNKKMLPFLTKVTAHEVDLYSEWQRHQGEIFVHVLSGVLIVHSELYEPLRLSAGESVYYDASAGHKWTSEGAEDAEVLWVHAQ